MKNEKGQAILLVIVVLGIFLIGAVGLAIDVSQLYAHQQMAQVAADAAAEAAMLSIFQGVDTATTGTSHTCSTTDTSVGCKYASMNGFGGTASDVVTVNFQTCSVGVCGTVPSPSTANQVRVTITRSVSNTLMRMVGASALSTIAATGIAAAQSVVAPIPLLITDPTNPNTLSMNGTTSVKICGGPQRSIQINSSSTSGGYQGGGSVDLSKGGPSSTTCTGTVASCCTGTGSDFGAFGGPTSNPGVNIGTTGHYIQPASPVLDPLAFVSAPSIPAIPSNPHGIAGETITSPTDGCTSTCTEYYPGLYVGGLNLDQQTVIFKPGVYYMQGGGFYAKKTTGGGPSAFNGLTTGMCTGCTPDAATGTGMVVYDTGPAGSTLGHNPSGGFTMDTNTSLFLRGSTLTTTDASGNIVPAGPYYGILFFEDHTANQNSHNLGTGNAQFAWSGTVYITNTRAIMLNDSTHVQSVTYNGGPSGNTLVMGEVIVGQLSMVGNTTFTMYLSRYGYLPVSQVALVGGGPHN